MNMQEMRRKVFISLVEGMKIPESRRDDETGRLDEQQRIEKLERRIARLEAMASKPGDGTYS